jgi:DNA helicase INO80
VQSISLLAWLAETQNIWGPFLVITPASTLHNWQQEISRFAPQLKPLPYWGVAKDRKTLRKFWMTKRLYTKDSPFHILVTSYQIAVQDQQYFQRVQWQYMILDEAHAIKSSNTARWKTLLNFNCRNRLLLTGTPVQNSMQELWALLHFIMPTLFDSHEEFDEWFSRDIERDAEKKSGLNEQQIHRLHMILKPFMLRRVKKDVQHELGQKIEKTVYCGLTNRQRRMYAALNERISIDELLDKATLEGNAEESDGLMNMVMHFRKVCNHPQLFELAEVQSPVFFFGADDRSFSSVGKDTGMSSVTYNPKNPIRFMLPKLIYWEAFLNLPTPANSYGSRAHVLHNMMSIYRADHARESVRGNDAFSFMLLDNEQFADLENIRRTSLVERLLSEPPRTQPLPSEIPDCFKNICLDVNQLHRLSILPAAFQPRVEASPVELCCSDRSFTYKQSELLASPEMKALLLGLPELIPNGPLRVKIAHYTSCEPTLGPMLLRHHSFSNIWVPNAKQLLFESGKLQELDRLLVRLKDEGHRVLIYFQMTKMIDLMEEYLSFRQYTYLRLDGSSKISDRRDMVMDWQTRDDIFIFLLSTRAGGLGINLTAADTGLSFILPHCRS